MGAPLPHDCRIDRRPHALSSLFVAFVPYNLPAPSYNTLGQQALLVACAAFGCAGLAWERGTPWSKWLVLSAAAWAVALVAYPPLLAPLGVLVLGMLLLTRPGRRFAEVYLLAITGGQLLAWGVVFATFGPQRIARSVEFQARLNSTFDPQAIPSRIAALITHNVWFAAILAVTIVVGVLRWRLPDRACAVMDSLLIGSVLLLPPALFSVSHGAVLIAALGGVMLFGGIRRHADGTAKILSLLYLTSWVAGFAMAGAGTIGPFKLPVGASLAAGIALAAAAGRWIAAGHPRIAPLPALTLWAVLLVSLFQSYYGEMQLVRPSARVRLWHGPFAGLAATSDDARVVQIAQNALHEHQRPGDTLAVLGRFVGFYLLGDAPVRALVPYALTSFAQPSAVRATHDYYAALKNRPSLVLIYRDPYFPLVNPFDPDFETWYAPQASLPTPLGQLEVFRRRDQVR
jgi:hypothetical protein